MAFSDVYWASQPLEIQALRSLEGSTREVAAQDLFKRGFTIDVPIMVWGWDPQMVMILRENAGMAWAPSAGQPNIGYSTGHGVDNPPFVPYDPTKPPAGSIRVSSNPDDYPPFVKPIPVPIPVENKVVGSQIFGALYAAAPGVKVDQNGNVTDPGGNAVHSPVSQDGSTYVLNVVRGLMGYSVTFTKE